jgi:heme exporter protein CcmD
MNHWAFVTAAYAVTIVGLAALLVQSFVAMRRAETRAAELKRNR